MFKVKTKNGSQFFYFSFFGQKIVLISIVQSQTVVPLLNFLIFIFRQRKTDTHKRNLQSSLRIGIKLLPCLISNMLAVKKG